MKHAALMFAAAFAGCGFQVSMGGDQGVPDDGGGSGSTDFAQGPDLATPPDFAIPTTWTAHSSGQANDLFAVAGAPGDVFAVGAKGTIVHSTDFGASWQAVNNPSGMAPLSAAWQLPGGVEAWASGETADLLSSSGGASGPFSFVQAPTAGFNLTGFWGSTSGDRYAVGFDRGSGTTEFGILHSSGGAFTDVSPDVPGGGLAKSYAVWGSSSADVYVVGDNGTIMHSSGDPASWGQQQTGVPFALYGVWGSSASDVYAVGTGGCILHSGGGGASSWVARTSNTTVTLRAVWGSSAGDVYAVGDGGTILHSGDGGVTWDPQTSHAPGAILYGIFGNDAYDVYAVGQGGITVHKP